MPGCDKVYPQSQGRSRHVRRDHGKDFLVPPGSRQQKKAPRDRKVKQTRPGRRLKDCEHTTEKCVCIRATVVRKPVNDPRLVAYETVELEGDEEATAYLLTQYKKELPQAYATMCKDGMNEEPGETDQSIITYEKKWLDKDVSEAINYVIHEDVTVEPWRRLVAEHSQHVVFRAREENSVAIANEVSPSTEEDGFVVSGFIPQPEVAYDSSYEIGSAEVYDFGIGLLQLYGYRSKYKTGL